jgi:hypothetical protein
MYGPSTQAEQIVIGVHRPGLLGQLSDTSDVGKHLTDRKIEQGNAWHWW